MHRAATSTVRCRANDAGRRCFACTPFGAVRPVASRPIAAAGSDAGRHGGSSPDEWLDHVVNRHASGYTRPEFLKAIRALSARYVEGRAALPDRSPLDSAGKRAAFAGYFAPLHFVVARAVLRQLSSRCEPAHIIDLGAGTGAAGLAWATTRLSSPATLTGVDLNTWVLAEMRWNARALNVPCRTERSNLERPLQRVCREHGHRPAGDIGIVCGWSLNELTSSVRETVCDGLIAAFERGASVLVFEPLARSAVPWWDDWQRRAESVGGRSDEWRLPLALPTNLADLDRAAGFRRDALTARSTLLVGDA